MIEIYTSPDDVQIAASTTKDRLGILCTAMRMVTSTGRVAQIVDSYAMMTPQQDSLYSKFACDGPQHKDSYKHDFCIYKGKLESVTTISCPQTLIRKALLTTSQLRRLWVGVGRHIHGVVMEFEDGTQF